MIRILLLLVLACSSTVFAQTSMRCAQAPNLACAIGTPSTQDIATAYNFLGAAPLSFEGLSPDGFETNVVVTDPTTPDKTLTIPNADTAPSQAISCSAGQHVATHSATTGAFTCTADTGGTNALLDATAHTDTVAQTVSRGSLIYGNATPKWDELTIGSANTILKSDGTDAAWGSITSAMIGPGDLASALTWNEVCTASPCTLAAAPRAADTALVFWRTLKLRRVAACGTINEYTLSGTTLTLCDSTGVGAGADGVQVTYEL